ncbi:DUF389 domain-containing protein [Pararhodonellum marinum]|uniref:DUF389 domain-containing protein n=1 Tax=Pararhodonellum marinum TaxID=2755358 RepID=UPI00188E02EB|nr:DUF389 domain-containing protein [Pararhodonellum marinum]
MKGITLLYDQKLKDEVLADLVPLFEQHLKIAVAFKADLTLELGMDDFIVTYLSDDQLREFLPVAIEKNWKLGYLPHPEMNHIRQGFGISSKLQTALQNILETEKTMKVDLLMANGRPVFNNLVIGETMNVMYGNTETNYFKRKWKNILNFFKLFRRVEVQAFDIVLEKEGKEPEVIKTAAVGMVVVQHGKSSLLSRRIIADSFINDGMMHNLIIAPHSVSGLMKFGFTSIFRSKGNNSLPDFAAHIKTQKMTIKSDIAVEFSLDSTLMSAKEIELEVVPGVLDIVPGRLLETNDVKKHKEVFKTQALPRGELRKELLGRPLPFINHATTEEFTWLFTILRDNSKTTSSFLVLMFLSTLIATFGLFGNSSPVIIGAMILAPLMNPIISLSMGVLRQDQSLVKDSLKAIGLGLLVGYVCAVLITWMTPLNTLNSEITARIRPNLLDLGVAVGSGVAGAYAHAKKEIAKTLAGVAIAVALVPPLAVSGIGLGWADWPVFIGSFLLLVTNLGGMVLAAALTFLLLGFSPFKLARKGLLISLIFVIGISTPLAFGFTKMVKENKIIQRLSGYETEHGILRDVNVRSLSPLRMSVTVISERPLGEPELRQVKDELEELVGEALELELRAGIKLY